MSAVATAPVNLEKIKDFNKEDNLAIDQFRRICTNDLNSEDESYENTIRKVCYIAFIAHFKAGLGDYSYLLQLLKANLNSALIQQINSNDPVTRSRLDFIAKKVQHAVDLNQAFTSIAEVSIQNYPKVPLTKNPSLDQVIPLERESKNLFSNFNEIINLENVQDAITLLKERPEICEKLHSYLGNVSIDRILYNKFTAILQLNNLEINLSKIDSILGELGIDNEIVLENHLKQIKIYYKIFRILIDDFKKNNQYIINENQEENRAQDPE